MTPERASQYNTRILVCDDNDAIHKDFRKVLTAVPDKKRAIDLLEETLFDDGAPKTSRTDALANLVFEIDSAYQGRDALSMAEQAHADGRPYTTVFMDVRMPPGWDGILTAQKIWEKLPHTEIVIVTAYSDYTWEEMIDKLGFNGRLLFIKKPFDSLTVRQMTLNLVNKWNLRHNMLLTCRDARARLEEAGETEENRACLEAIREWVDDF